MYKCIVESYIHGVSSLANIDLLDLLEEWMPVMEFGFLLDEIGCELQAVIDKRKSVAEASAAVDKWLEDAAAPIREVGARRLLDLLWDLDLYNSGDGSGYVYHMAELPEEKWVAIHQEFMDIIKEYEDGDLCHKHAAEEIYETMGKVL